MRIGEALFAGSLATLAGPLAPELPADTDLVFAEAFTACLAAISGRGVPDESLGWATFDTEDIPNSSWENWTHRFSTKDVAGVGGLSLSVIVESYPGYDLGLCDVTIHDPERVVASPALTAAGFKGTVEGDADEWSGVWRNANGTLFVRGFMSTIGDLFTLSVTSVGKKS